MESMNVANLGGNVLDMLVERMTMHGGISFKSAWLRPVQQPISRRIDVTKGFSTILRDSMIITDRMISPQDLVDASHHREDTWLNIFTSASNVGADAISGDWWLCILFMIPGNFSYIVTYNIPNEFVNFPPNMEGNAKITPMCRQIISAGIEFSEDAQLPHGGENEEEEEEEEEEKEEENIVLLDMTNQVRMMVGSDGNAFGRGWIDIQLIVANTMEEPPDLTSFSNRILNSTLMGGRMHGLVVRTADGGCRLSDGIRWYCPNDQRDVQCANDD
jgi:hypothetical protein